MTALACRSSICAVILPSHQVVFARLSTDQLVWNTAPSSKRKSAMPPKSRSSSSKAATQKAALGFSATKKGVPPSSKQQGAAAKATKASAQTNGKATTKKSDLAGLYPRLYKEALRKMGPPSKSARTFSARRREGDAPFASPY